MGRWNRELHRFVRRFVLTLLICLILNVVIFNIPSLATTPRHYQDLSFPPVPDIKLPNYERFQLDNGLVVYLVEDHELPLVSGSAFFRVGNRWEPGDRVGLANLTGYLMRSGGTQHHSVEELNDFLEQRAAAIETSISATSGGASFTGLSEDLPAVLTLFGEVIREPLFPEERLTLAKSLFAGNIDRRNDDPANIASREFQKLIYGNASPYARTVEYATLDSISREDIVAFYQDFIYPNRTILGIVGDFDSQALRKQINQIFGDWQPTSDPLPPLPPIDSKFEQAVFGVEQPQMTQSYVQMGHLGGLLNDPDYPALTVLNEVLNGFGGRLYNEIRSRQGLAYSVYTNWQASYDFPGIFIAGGQTRTETTIPFIQAIRQEIAKIRETPITGQELQYAKDVVLNSLIFNFQTPDQTLYRLMRYEYYGYPQDFIFRYQKAVEASTVADIQRVAQTYLHPDEMKILVVGNLDPVAADLNQLSPIGKVQTIDISIPRPAQLGT
jgi:zinc protease